MALVAVGRVGEDHEVYSDSIGTEIEECFGVGDRPSFEEDPMVHPSVANPAGEGAPLPGPAATWIRSPAQSLERLVPLIRSLLTSDLVYRSKDGTFQLRDDVQQRLEEMATVSPSPAPRVFLGRRCESCGSACTTWLVNGSRICMACGGPTGSTPRTGRTLPPAA